MDTETYAVTEVQPLSYSFISVGPKGAIRKIVVFQKTGVADEYNLALLDETPAGFSDLTISDNNDMERVLATVIQTIDLFFEQLPQSVLIFTGSSAARTRLYRAVIAKYLHRASAQFTIFGVRNDDVEKFVSNTNYTAFIIRLNHEK